VKECGEIEGTVLCPHPRATQVCSNFKPVTKTEGNKADRYQPFDGH